MTTTDPILFQLQDTQDGVTVEGKGRTFSVEGGWFKILNTDHGKQGLQFLFPLKHPEYDAELQDTLTSLSPGDEKWMTATPVNEKQTAWRVERIVDKEIPSL